MTGRPPVRPTIAAAKLSIHAILKGIELVVVCLACVFFFFVSPSFGANAALEWESGDSFRSAPLSFDASGKPGFSLLPPSETGIGFANRLSDEKAAENQIRLNGSGVALGDIDGDGLCDVFFCRLEGGNALFRNLGDWRFEEIDVSSTLACADQFSTGAVFADVDGDRDLDLLISGIGVGARLFLNDGGGTFVESKHSGLVKRLGASSMALADVEGDGDLDLYVANYRTTTIRTTGFAVLNVGGRRMIRPQDRNHLEYKPEGRVLEHGEPDIFYRNDGTGRFIPDTWTQGTFLDEDDKPLTKPPFDWGLSVMFRDIDANGSPDLYVCNDFHSTDKIWINDGDGHFRLIPRLALRNTSTFSMTVDFADIDRDGFDDIFVADMLSLKHSGRMMQEAAADVYASPVGVFTDRPQFDRNTVQWNRGDGTYAEVAAYAGLTASEWTWSSIFLDVDLDGYEDLICSTGHLFNTQDLDAEMRIRAKGPWRRDQIPRKLLMFPRMPQANVAFRNRGDLTFEQVSDRWGFNQVGVSHGMALADLDNDGDLDVVVNNLNESAGVYRNNCPAPRVAVRLKGANSNSFGVGARIRLLGGMVDQSQEMIAGGRYLSCDEALRVFAAGSDTSERKIEVRWLGGKISTIKDVRANQLYEIDELGATDQLTSGGPNPKSPVLRSRTTAERGKIENQQSASPLFEEAGAILSHRHSEQAFDDFARQPLLPRKLSRLGPGVAWHDVNDDGWEDLIVGGGKGGSLAVKLNDGKGGFQSMKNDGLSQQLTRDQTGVVGWKKASGETILTFGSSNYEDGLDVGSIVRQFNLGDGTLSDSVSGQPSSAGPIAMADVDGDGDLDLFVGGRCIPGRWPEPASSFLFLNRNGRLELDEERSAPFEGVGLVSGAVFTDLNSDGRPDLALACDWGPVRVFINHDGRMSDGTAELGLEPYAGIWNGINAGDFDGDGRLDLVASNWGFNSSYQSVRDSSRVRSVYFGAENGPSSSAVRPPLVYFRDFDSNTSIDVVEAVFDTELGRIVPIRDLNTISRGLPIVRARFQSFDQYNQADVFQMTGGLLREVKPLKATWLASSVFLNRGDRFEVVPLPRQAQFSPGFGVCVSDFDGDGSEDVFMSQNFFANHPSMPRLDAGRSLLIRGTGSGGFEAVSGAESGIRVYGEGRGAAVSDYDRDGRVDLVVAQNGAATVLYRNRQARPGLRVRLKGSPENPTAVGASIRLISGEMIGPAREIHSGSGYWSQDSGIVVMSKPPEAFKVWVRWPGGKETITDVPVEAREIAVSQEGVIE